MWPWKKKLEQPDQRRCFQKNTEGKCALVAPGGNGQPLTPFIYDDICQLQTDGVQFYHCIRDEKHGLLDLDGSIVVPCEMDSLEADRNVILLKKGDKHGLYATQGLYVSPQYDEIGELDSFVHVRQGSKWGFIDLEEGHFMDETDESAYEKGMLMYF